MGAVSEAALSLEEAAAIVGRLQESVQSAVFGQEELIKDAMCCFLAGGHILMTGAPGLAKTTLVRVFASNLGLDFGRIQFTPDLLPTDIIGSEVLNIDPESGKRSFSFSRGPVFTDLLLADEINRASPRTQSALLEAMQERTCTVGGERYSLGHPFMVFATQNPFESEGTFPLPEAQMDRFLVHSLVDYPTSEAEARILQEHVADKLVGEANSHESAVVGGATTQLDRSTVQALMTRCRKMPIDDELLEVIRDLVRATRPDDSHCPDHLRSAVWYGAGPRAGLSLVSTSRALALIEGSERVRWAHIKRMAKPVLRHRVRLTAQASHDGLSEDAFIDELMVRLEGRIHNLAKGIV